MLSQSSQSCESGSEGGMDDSVVHGEVYGAVHGGVCDMDSPEEATYASCVNTRATGCAGREGCERGTPDQTTSDEEDGVPHDGGSGCRCTYVRMFVDVDVRTYVRMFVDVDVRTYVCLWM